MAVAPIRWAYSRPCRFYQDQTVETRIVWYFAAPGADVLPYRTVFWDRQHDYGGGAATTVGEVDGSKVIGREAVPPVVVLPGDHSEGTAADFMGESSEPQTARDGVQTVECQRLPPTCGFFCSGTEEDIVTVETPCCTLPTPALLTMDIVGTGYLSFMTGSYVLQWNGAFLWSGDYDFGDGYEMSLQMSCNEFTHSWSFFAEAFFPAPNPVDGAQTQGVSAGGCGPPVDLTFGPYDFVRLDATAGTLTFRVHE